MPWMVAAILGRFEAATELASERRRLAMDPRRIEDLMVDRFGRVF